MSAQDNKEMVRKLYETVSSGKLDDLDSYLSRDFTDHNPNPGQKPGVEGAKELFHQFHSSFSGFRMEVDDLIAEGDKVVSRATVHGKHTGDFMGIFPTGKQFSIPVIDIFRISGGRLAEHWGVADTMGPFSQLGMNVNPSEMRRAA